MSEINKDKIKQINDMVSVVKLASLMFTAIIFFQYVFNDNEFLGNLVYQQIIFMAIGVVMLLLLSIYIIWAFSLNDSISKSKYRKMIFVENLAFIAIFFIVVLLSGAYKSEYKYIFLFIITSSTIQLGLKHGITVAVISSSLILGIDIFCVNTGEVNNYFQTDLILCGIFILTAWPLGFYVKIEGEHINNLEELVNKDGLTGVFNHRYFHDALKEKITVSEKDKKPLSMIFVDIDYFKHYNDLYGHQKGDEVLRTIGKILRDNLRTDDIAARYGGEEFAVILPNTDEEEAMIIANKIRKIIEDTEFYGEKNQPNGVLTASMGVSVYPDKAKDDISLIKSADDALYRAKFFKKNRVEKYTSILDEMSIDIEEKDVELVASIKTLIIVINAKDRYTYGHSERVALYSKLMADKLELSEKDKKRLVYGAYMHDIGKINVAKDILNKKMPLTNEEWEILKRHPQDGIEMIKHVKALEDITPIILHHHEKYNGTGYPNNLKGEEIPYLARILSVIDSFDAMTSNRPYNIRKSYDEGIDELRKFSGIQFDKEIVEKFIEVIQENKDHLDNLI
ncbi:HD-GYP domain-containing protein [Clostridium sp. Sa3CUN1]|uniref:HD-GYP domain-containing protein n=1 Tax=Clostridium gallinarum TaxID=2762246 RepID=A0ABR8Q007_9CLOT|nr:HD-GYP domain-containing protein [Clostridium gallinarum]MBD7913752.1 HD-GYP domain-containing protein [Clostridium gallinarum]